MASFRLELAALVDVRAVDLEVHMPVHGLLPYRALVQPR